MSRQFKLGHRDCGGYIWCYKGKYVYASVLLTPGGSRCPTEGDGHVNNWFCSMSQYIITLSLSLSCSTFLLFLHLPIHSLKVATAQASLAVFSKTIFTASSVICDSASFDLQCKEKDIKPKENDINIDTWMIKMMKNSCPHTAAVWLKH